MKITLPKNYKQWMTVQEFENAREIIREFKGTETASFREDVQSAARVASRSNGDFEILKMSAEIAGNARAENLYNNESGRLDIWVDAYAFDAYEGFYSFGFYLSDLWQLTGENREEIRARMYIREYKKQQNR
jgi:hypothetical protein